MRAKRMSDRLCRNKQGGGIHYWIRELIHQHTDALFILVRKSASTSSDFPPVHSKQRLLGGQIL